MSSKYQTLCQANKSLVVSGKNYAIMKQLEGYHCRRIPFLGLIGSVNFCLVLRESGLEEIIATYRQQVLVLNYILYKYSSYSFFPSLRKVFGF